MRRNLLPSLTLLLSSAIMIVGVFLAGSSIDIVEPAPGNPNADILYLPDPTQPGLDLDEARADGARIAPSAESLQADASSHIVGIAFDASQIGQLSRPWLASQIARGRVIAGINVTMTELEDTLGLHDLGASDGFRHDWFGRPFYSFTHRSPPESNPRYAGRASDQLHSAEQLFFVMRRQVRQAQGTSASPSPP